MRILVGTGLNQGTAEYQNIGDIAMLQVAVARVAELWPDAEILVLTDSERDLDSLLPASETALTLWRRDLVGRRSDNRAAAPGAS